MSRYFLWFDLSAVLFVLGTILDVLGREQAIATALEIASLLLLMILFPSRRRDEFAQHCWVFATNWAFAVLVVAPVVIAFGRGMVDGFTGSTSAFDLPWEATFSMVLLVFFAAFEWARFLGRRA